MSAPENGPWQVQLIESLYRRCQLVAHGHVELITTTEGDVCVTLGLVGYTATGVGVTITGALIDLGANLDTILAMLGRREQTGAPNV